MIKDKCIYVFIHIYMYLYRSEIIRWLIIRNVSTIQKTFFILDRIYRCTHFWPSPHMLGNVKKKDFICSLEAKTGQGGCDAGLGLYILTPVRF